MTCDAKLNLSGGCNRCGRHADPLHFVERTPNALDCELLCANCCPVHGYRPPEWTDAPKTIAGTQEGLF
jgi:hypothetical protein